jgi:hypothetical protein
MMEERSSEVDAGARRRAVEEHFGRLFRVVLAGAAISLLLIVPAIYVLARAESPTANIVVGTALVAIPMAAGYAALRRRRP